MPAVSIYLREEALAALDGIVSKQAALDKAAGLAGRKVANRSSILEGMILEKAQGSSNSMEDITYAIVELAEEYGAAEVSVFGSFARGEATESSDIDILLEKGEIKGMRVLDFQEDLSQRLGRRVDVVTTAGASERFLKRIEKDCVKIFDVNNKKRA